jgi:hypothetical protein
VALDLIARFDLRLLTVLEFTLVTILAAFAPRLFALGLGLSFALGKGCGAAGIGPFQFFDALSQFRVLFLETGTLL